MTTEAGADPIDVVLADDHAMVRAGLRLVLDAAPGIRVVAEAGDVEAALTAVRRTRPRILVLDLNMPGRPTIPAIGDVLAEPGAPGVVMVTMEEDPEAARLAIAAGAGAYVLKDAAEGELVAAVRAVARGETYVNPRLGARLAALADAPAANDELAIGAVFADHRVEALAGRGGMAVVYRATDLALDRTVALKLVSAPAGGDRAFQTRFKGECRRAASLDHPHVVPVYRAGEEGGRLYLTMRFVDGPDLHTVLRRETRLPPARAVELLAQVAAGLDAAHARGLVHRDVKPGNVLIEPRGEGEHAYLTDFGLTIDPRDAQALTRTGFAVGTADYMSPEQARGSAEVDARADVYALGCVLFRMLTGSPPFERPSEVETLWAHLNDPPPGPRSLAPELPSALDAVIARALAKRPEARHASATGLAAEAATAIATL